MLKTLLLPVVLLILFISCEEETAVPEETVLETPVCTGFAYRDANNIFLRSVGLPDNKLINSSDYKWVLKAYPIPAFYNITLEFNKPGKKKIWITAANVSDELLSEPVFARTASREISDGPLLYGTTTGSQMNFNISSLPEGAYRLYVQYGDELYWENVLITTSTDF